MSKQWAISSLHEKAHEFAKTLGIHAQIASLLLRRGLGTREAIQTFLNPSLQNLESPFAFRDMQKAVERIRRAISKQEKILVYGDYDVDGVTGTAIVYPVLKKLGADVEAYMPHRIDEGYGLNKESILKLMEKKFKLVITVDNGISGAEVIETLNQKGVDTIIVDHHLPKDKFPPAYAIVSSCIEDKGDANLAACGLAFKLAWALLDDLEKAKEYLDLVTLGTIADLAPVLGDNRILLKFGLPYLANTKKPGLKALMTVASILPRMISYRDIAFGLGPRINASGRMSSPEHAFKLLTTENEYEARNLASLLDQGNKDRQKAEKEAFEEALEIVEADPLKDSQAVLVVDHASWHEGVLGIVASRLVERYQKPSIVISHRGGLGKGSGRSVGTFSLHENVLLCEEFLTNFGGHAQACGLTIEKSKINGFRTRLNEIIKSRYKKEDFTGEVLVDGELQLSEIDLKFLTDLEKMAPFGNGNKKPLFLSKSVLVKGEPKKRGQDTLVFWASDLNGKTTCEAVGFRMHERFASRTKKPAVDIVYQPALKQYQGITSIELQLEDFR